MTPTTTERKGDWFYTQSGKQFWFLDPRPEEIDITDIAHGLSHACRFAGQTPRFYSVAEHSVNVSYLCERFDADNTLALWGLLHDASEAYLCDIPRPLKMQPIMSGYREVEDLVQWACYEKFGLPPGEEPARMKLFDNVMLAIEARDLFPHLSALSTPLVGVDEYVARTAINVMNPMEPEYARNQFLARFKILNQRIAAKKR